MDTEDNDFMSQTIDKLPPDRAVAVAKIAARYRLAENDPAWLLVNAVVDADAAAAAAGAAAQAVQAETAKIPDQVYHGAVRAGDEIRGAISKSIDEKTIEMGQALKLTIEHVSSRGVSSLKSASKQLEQTATAAGEKFVTGWSARAVAAAEQHARSAVNRSIATRWGMIAGVMSGALAIGIVIGFVFARLTAPDIASYGMSFYDNGGTRLLIENPVNFNRCLNDDLCVTLTRHQVGALSKIF